MQLIPRVSPAAGVNWTFFTQVSQRLKPCVESGSPILVGFNRNAHAAPIRQIDRVIEL
jgi:hypothetical protein